MSRDDFLHILADGLAGLPAAEIDDILTDYAAHFEEARASGRTEQEVAAALGDPKRLARELRAETGLRRWENHHSFRNLHRRAVRAQWSCRGRHRASAAIAARRSADPARDRLRDVCTGNRRHRIADQRLQAVWRRTRRQSDPARARGDRAGDHGRRLRRAAGARTQCRRQVARQLCAAALPAAQPERTEI
ncbi:DUF1700 domain-containing protein [Bradyrhizobium betae]